MTRPSSLALGPALFWSVFAAVASGLAPEWSLLGAALLCPTLALAHALRRRECEPGAEEPLAPVIPLPRRAAPVAPDRIAA